MKKLLFLSIFLPVAGMAQVGIGTTNPQAKLHVAGDLRIDTVPEQTSGTMNLALDTATGKLVKQGATKASGFLNAGVPVTLGNISVQMSTNGNRSLEIRMTSTAALSGTSLNTFNGNAIPAGGAGVTRSGHTRRSDSFTGGTFFRWEAGANFNQYGSTQQILLMDETNDVAYEIKMIVGNNYLGNFISIEKL